MRVKRVIRSISHEIIISEEDDIVFRQRQLDGFVQQDELPPGSESEFFGGRQLVRVSDSVRPQSFLERLLYLFDLR